ncbi:MAG: tetratricopeptide repeat protein [Candidatus Schekmanbacteria bacterium]|nr:tetratricopeptide repeat protein [Candidatus Schekmanbacteria bacterium]
MTDKRLNATSTIAAVILLFTACFILYRTSLKVPFLFDDLLFISSNSSSNWGISVFFHNMGIFISRPLLGLSFAANYEISRNSPAGFHIGNLIIHSINCSLIFFVLKKLLRTTYGELTILNKNIVSFSGALFFLVHPLATESVTYVSGRSSLLYTMFLLLSVLLYISFEENKGEWKWFFYGFSLLAYVASLASKEIAAICPLILIAVIFFFLLRDNKKLNLIPILPFFFIPIATVLLRKASLLSGASPDGTSRNIIVQLMTEIYVLAESVFKVLFPVNLNFDPDYSDITTPIDSGFFIGLIVLTFMIAAVFYVRKKNPFIVFSILFFLISFSPHLFIRLRDYMSERWLYFPLISVSFLIAGILATTSGKNQARGFVKYSPAAIIFVVIVIFSALTLSRLEVWQSADLIWTDTVKKSPGKFRVHANLGHVFLREEKFPEAEKELLKAININKEYAEVHYDLAQVYSNLGKDELAYAEYGNALKYMTYYDDPAYSVYYNSMINMGVISFKNGDKQKAMELFSNAIKLDNRYPQAFNNLGIVFMNMGDMEKAELNFLMALNRDPKYAMAYYNLADVYIKEGRNDEAAEILKKVKSVKPD